MQSDGDENEETIVFLTLGDGDFSYSLDLARYLSGENDDSNRTRRRKLIASGIDNPTELSQKYKNSSNILRRLKGLANSHKHNNDSVLDVSVQHGVNALDEKRGDEWRAHHVIFNHPHLGIEDAKLHSRFISHFLYVVANHWLHMSGGGILHLTLAKGQYERWKTQAAATKHGLVLLERNAFQPPPVTDGQAEYHHRRHQTGKSFAPRVEGSETFTFGRKKTSNENSNILQHVAVRLPWQNTTVVTKMDNDQEKTFSCPHCIKSFHEERSLKNHLKCVHNESKKRRRGETGNLDLVCTFCKSAGIQRTFAHAQGLEDHICAKHTGLHSNIQPDWYLQQQQSQADKVSKSKRKAPPGTQDGVSDKSSGGIASTEFGSCEICGLVYTTENDKEKHLKEFIPVESKFGSDEASAAASYMTKKRHCFVCQYCKKSFREHRAQLQHENFCNKNKQNSEKV
mmetsp:Transcript_18609/g.25821  ORF Transcript_18609/g.25821 Transcript_18609/m.25821 type:complete len:455 (+) Transcript_18609:95-1459(+)